MVKIIEIYFELIRLVAALNKYEEMRDLYLESMEYILEGQNDLFNCNEQIESVLGKDLEVQFKAFMDKYHTLHEGNVRYSISLAVFCLDYVANHKDIDKSPERYCRDDLSYKVSKIEKCKNYSFTNDLNSLLLGINPHIRNAISHKTVQYGEDSIVTFCDRTWAKEYSIREFEALVEAIEINFNAQMAALTLFTYEYEDQLDFKVVKPYFNLKQLRIEIDRQVHDSYFVTRDITFDEENSCIICDVEKKLGFDSPSELFGNIKGFKFRKKIPKLDAEHQALRVAHTIALLRTDFDKCRINVLDCKDSVIGYIEVDLAQWTKLAEQESTKSDFEKHILANTLKREKSNATD